MRAGNSPGKEKYAYQGETKLVRLWLPAQRLEGEEHGLDVFQGNSSTSFAACLLWTRVREAYNPVC